MQSGSEATKYRIITSPSKEKDYLTCPAKAHNAPRVKSDIQLAGSIRHTLMRAHLRQGLKLVPADVKAFAEKVYGFETLDLEMRSDIVESVVHAGTIPGFVPHIDTVISVEGDNLDPQNTYRFTRSESKEEVVLFQFELADDILVRMAMDVIFDEANPRFPDVLKIGDWKGRSVEDYEVEAAFYCLGTSIAVPGYAEYIFETRHLGTGARNQYSYKASDMADVRRYLVALVEARHRAEHWPEKVNRWCHTCPLNGDCVSYNAATTTAPFESSKAAKKEPAPEDPVDLVHTWDDVRHARLVCEAREEVLYPKVKAVLKDRSVVHNGQELYLGTRKGDKTVLEGAAKDLCASVGIHDDEVTGFRRDLFEVAYSSARADMTPEMIKHWDQKFEECFTQAESESVKRRPVK